jgi:hypothetical protein
LLVVLDDSMAATSARRSSTRRMNARRSAEVGYLVPGSGNCMTITRGVATPTLSSYILSTLRTSSPVPDSRITASAICDTVIIAIQRCW